MTPADTGSVADVRPIVAAARAYLDGQAGVVATARIVADLVRGGNFAADDLLVGFTAIDFESDSFPLGEGRKTWNLAALARADAAREQYESSMAHTMTYMCRQIVASFT